MDSFLEGYVRLVIILGSDIWLLCKQNIVSELLVWN